MQPKPIAEAFDDWLTEHSLQLEAAVVGGAALALLGTTSRQTRDFDILDPELPLEILESAREFAKQMRGDGIELTDDWLNNGPIELVDVLPREWQSRQQVVFEGRSLRLTTLGRSDLLKTKLFALCDRGTDLADCIALAPTIAELEEAKPWLSEQDANPLWPEHVSATLDDLSRRLKYGV